MCDSDKSRKESSINPTLGLQVLFVQCTFCKNPYLCLALIFRKFKNDIPALHIPEHSFMHVIFLEQKTKSKIIQPSQYK
jgi:Cdc6-like AAA superfamily ATPase